MTVFENFFGNILNVYPFIFVVSVIYPKKVHYHFPGIKVCVLCLVSVNILKYMVEIEEIIEIAPT